LPLVLVLAADHHGAHDLAINIIKTPRTVTSI
jgi:hypothetical protein